MLGYFTQCCACSHFSKWYSEVQDWTSISETRGFKPDKKQEMILRRVCSQKRSGYGKEISRVVNVMFLELSTLSKIIPKMLICECRMDCKGLNNDSAWERCESWKVDQFCFVEFHLKVEVNDIDWWIYLFCRLSWVLVGWWDRRASPWIRTVTLLWWTTKPAWCLSSSPVGNWYRSLAAEEMVTNSLQVKHTRLNITLSVRNHTQILYDW